jgi:DNA-binding PadR family transcriptional regulator
MAVKGMAEGEFFQLNDLEQHLLGWISSEGENTIYGLEKLAREHNREARARSQHPMKVSHATISRTIKDLLDRGYIEVSKEEPYRTGQNKKYYAVSAKGWFSSLAAVSIDKTHAVQSLHPVIAQLTHNVELGRMTMLFFKIQLCLWFQWHIVNGLVLSKLKDASVYRRRFVPDNGILFYGPDSKVLAMEYSDQLLLRVLRENIEKLARRSIEPRDLLYALEGANLVLGTRFLAQASEENALGLLLLADIYRTLWNAKYVALDDRDYPADIVAVEVGDNGTLHEVAETATDSGDHYPSLEEALDGFREYLWGAGFLESYAPLPEKEIIQLYDSILKQTLE